jgi:hypothetical protein
MPGGISVLHDANVHHRETSDAYMKQVFRLRLHLEGSL